jgi:Protein of unknown function (DUF3592)
LLLTVCAGLFYYAVTAFHVGPMTWIVGGVVLVHWAEKVCRILFVGEKRLQLSAWRQMVAQRSATRLATVPIQRLEDVVSMPERRAQEARQKVALQRLAPLLLIAGVGLLGLGVRQSRALMQLQSLGVRTHGVISSLSLSSSGSGSRSYYPVVTYTDQAGKSARFRDNTGSNPPMYHVGDSVTVLYSPAALGNAIIDRGLWNWLPSGILYLLGVLLSAAGIGLLSRRASGSTAITHESMN